MLLLVNHAELAKECGIPEKNIAVLENGDILRVENSKIKMEREKAPANYVMVDGLGVGDFGEVVLRDRQALANDGIFVIITVVNSQTGKVVGSPDIISRGFVYLRKSQSLLAETRKKTIEIVNQAAGQGKSVNWAYVKNIIRNKLVDFLFSKTKKRPMILPVVIEV